MLGKRLTSLDELLRGSGSYADMSDQERMIAIMVHDFALVLIMDTLRATYVEAPSWMQGPPMQLWQEAFGPHGKAGDVDTVIGVLMDPRLCTRTSLNADDRVAVGKLLNFTRTGYVTAYEFCVFLRWFGPFKGAMDRCLEAVADGLVSGFVPAVEASTLLRSKRAGTFLVRMSKTKPGNFAVTFVDRSQLIKNVLLHAVEGGGVTLKQPPTRYESLKVFVRAHAAKLKFPLNAKYRELCVDTLDLLPSQSPPRAVPSTTAPAAATSPSPAAAAAGATADGDADGEGDTNKCLVCWDQEVGTVFLECGHLACCRTCANELFATTKACPICRGTIVRVVNVFKPS